jgi:hypothetical protein
MKNSCDEIVREYYRNIFWLLIDFKILILSTQIVNLFFIKLSNQS